MKDTIDQWLEAQVINVRNNEVFIHYNGWGNRWDEWIDMASDRIMPFRFHTQQNTLYNYHSPFPNSKPDADVSMQGNSSNTQDFFEYFSELQKSFKYVNEYIDDIKNKRNVNNNLVENKHDNQLEVYYLMKNITPLFDRLGRTMTDMGSYLNFNMRNNKLEE